MKEKLISECIQVKSVGTKEGESSKLPLSQ
jgi:hypothetical protein